MCLAEPYYVYKKVYCQFLFTCSETRLGIKVRLIFLDMKLIYKISVQVNAVGVERM